MLLARYVELKWTHLTMTRFHADINMAMPSTEM